MLVAIQCSIKARDKMVCGHLGKPMKCDWTNWSQPGLKLVLHQDSDPKAHIQSCNKMAEKQQYPE